MNKAFLLNILQEYDLKKGLQRRILGADPYIIKLKKFVHNELCAYSIDEDLRILELQDLYRLLSNRKNSLADDDQYYNRNRLTNNAYHKIIFALAEEKFTQVTAKSQVELSRKPFVRFCRGLAKCIYKIFPKIYKYTDMLIFRIFRNLDPVHFEILRDTLGDANVLAGNNYYNFSMLKTSPTHTLARAEQYDRVFLNVFKYKDVLGQKNSLHLQADNLDELDPRLLALDDEGNLIFAEDVVTDFKVCHMLFSPERSVANKPLPEQTVQQILVTKPFFRDKLNEALQVINYDIEEFVNAKPYKLNPELVNGLRLK